MWGPQFDFSLDFRIDASSLPAELQRLVNTIRELDERSQCKTVFPYPNSTSFVGALMVYFLDSFLVVEAMINQTRQQTKYCLGLSSQSSKRGRRR